MLLLRLGAVNVPSGGAPLSAGRSPTRFGAPASSANSSSAMAATVTRSRRQTCALPARSSSTMVS